MRLKKMQPGMNTSNNSKHGLQQNKAYKPSDNSKIKQSRKTLNKATRNNY